MQQMRGVTILGKGAALLPEVSPVVVAVVVVVGVVVVVAFKLQVERIVISKHEN